MAISRDLFVTVVVPTDSGIVEIGGRVVAAWEHGCRLWAEQPGVLSSGGRSVLVRAQLDGGVVVLARTVPTEPHDPDELEMIAGDDGVDPVWRAWAVG